MKNRLIILFSLLTVPLFAQIGGSAVYQFLNVATSAKQASLGGKVYTGLKGDIFQPAYNPATIDSTMENKLGVNYVNYLSDINYGNIAYAQNVKNLGMVYAAITYVNYGTFEYAEIDGTRSGTFGASESAITLGYAYHIPQSKWQVGLSTKFIFSSLESYTSTGWAFDAGVLYKNPETGIVTALVARNFGWQLSTYQGTKESLPFEIDFTFAKTFAHAPFKWFVTFENLQEPEIAFVNTAHNTQDPNGNIIEEDITTIDQIFRHILIGVEMFPRKRFNLRAGYNFRRAAELNLDDQRFANGMNFGFGLQLRKFEINYAYGSFSYASNANFISIIVNLNEF